MTLHEVCPDIIVRTFVKDGNTFMSSKSGVYNKTSTNTLHFHDEDVLIMYAVLTSVSSFKLGEGSSNFR